MQRLKSRQTTQSPPGYRILTAAATAAGVIASLLVPVSAAVAAPGADWSRKWSPPNTPLARTASVDGKDAALLGAVKPAHPVPPVWQPAKPVAVPKGHADVRLSKAPAAKRGSGVPEAGEAARAAGLPVALAPLAGSSVAEQSVGVDVVDPRTAGAAGIPGPVVALSRASGAKGEGPVRLSLDLAKLAPAYGGDWASRVRLVALPACALTTPQNEECRKQTPVESQLDRSSGQLSADVVLPGGDGAVRTQLQGVGAASAQQGLVLAAVAGASSGAGTFSATSLNVSQAWAAGSSSGSFGYNYPVQVPPGLGSGAPKVELGYDSAAVDGKTSSTNAQASWIGDGWDYSTGFVERSYQSCSKAGITGSGDECWAGANLTLSLAGHSGELVPDDASCQSGAAATTEQSACTWRLKGDDGSRVQFLTGATNGTWNGSYIKVTDTAGTVYYFGLNHLPDASGNPSTKGPDSGSAWTVPVYSPNAGDPCYDSAKGKSSWCQTAWRWNLDYVVDAHGNLITYTYTPETNSYSRGGAQNSGTGTLTQYTRSGVLQSIGYGQLLSDQIAANGGYNPAAKVVFGSGERCVTSILACDPVNRTSAHAGDWPDVPMDQQCASTGACTVYGPTFWSSKWLNSITTQVRYNGAYQDVDVYTLTHRFVNVQNSTENTQVPWLASVQRTGKDQQATGGQLSLPPVSFTEMLLPNRVDGTNLVPSRPAYNRPRIQLITTETGSTIGVDYYPADCSRVNNVMPGSADTDTRSCYNVKWHTPNEAPGADPVDDWFQRYPVKTVTVNPGTPGSAPMTTAYTYGSAAWHRNNSPLVDAKDRTWDDFRGYASVTTVAGNGNDGPKAQGTATFHQGMDGDFKADGTSRSVTVAGPMSGQVTDSDWLSGQTLETDTYTQAGGTVASYTVNTSSGPVTTATHNRSGLPALIARYDATTSTVTSKSLKSDGSWVSTTETTTTDPAHNNRPVTVLDQADGIPDACQRTSYATGPDPQVTSLVSEELTVSGTSACTATPGQQNTLTWNRTYYDGKPFGQASSKADVTSTEVVDHYTGTTPAFVVTGVRTYDAYGRALSVTDPNTTDSTHQGGSTVTTVYTAPQAGELPTSTSVTSPAPAGASDAATGRTAVTALDSARALVKSTTDANGRATNVTYDALGRTSGVWNPGRSTSLSPTVAYSYAIPGVVNGQVVPPSTSTTTLVGAGTNGVYTSVTSTAIMDGTGRTIQTQSPPALSVYSGRLLTDTAYDSQGRVIRANASWYNDAARPGTVLYQESDTQRIPAQTHTVYDGRGRATTVESIAYGVVQNTVTTAYPGAERTDVTPLAGATPTSTVVDALGRTTQLWQYRTPTATGNPADADVTTYAFDQTGRPSTRKDAAGNTWSYTYDVRGRQTSVTDPDTGTSTTAYDSVGRVTSTTDARGRSIFTTYDLLGRPTATFDGLLADPAKQLTARTYDTLLKGQPTSSTRYVGGASGAAYTQTVGAYDTAYRPTKVTTTVPGSEVGSATPLSYTYQAIYDQVTGLLLQDNRPALGGLASEPVAYSYEAYGLLANYGTTSASYDLSNDYDAYGRPVRTTVNPYGTQIVVTNAYDESTGRQLSQFVDKQTAATGAVQQTTYAYDASGRVTGIRTIPDNTVSATDLQCFSYDYLNRLTTAWTDKGALNLAPNPAVGGQGACANTSPTSGAVAPATNTVGGSIPYWQDYTYDLTGNRKSLTVHDPSGDTTKDTVTTQTFTATGAVNNGSGAGGPHALTGTGTAVNGATDISGSSKYDAAGNTTGQYTNKTGTTTFDWNTEGKLERDTPPVQIQGIGGKCLALQGGSSAAGTPAEIVSCTSGGGQKIATTGNLLKVLNKCLTAAGTTSGSAVQLQTCNGSTAQTWTPQSNGTVLNGAGTNLCLTVPGDVTTSGTDTVVATCGTGTVPVGQKWTVPDNATTYVYDADGNQLVRRNPGRATITLGGDELVCDTVAKTSVGTRYYTMPGGLSLVRQGNTATWQIGDHHGTGNLALDGTTLAETRRPTDPFGNPRGTQPTGWVGTHGFVGGTKDDATGLTNLGARQYDPRTGRFINPDPLLEVGDPQQWNGYAYSNNDPVNNSDPSGLMCVHGAPGGSLHRGAGGRCNAIINDTSNNCTQSYCQYDAQELMENAWDAGMWDTAPDEPPNRPGHGRQWTGSGWDTVAGIGKWAVDNFDLILKSRFGCAVTRCDFDVKGGYEKGVAKFGVNTQSDRYRNGYSFAGIAVMAASVAGMVRSAAARAALSGESSSAELKAVGGCSFSPETPVLLENGNKKPISAIAIGDSVMAADAETGRVVAGREVTKVWINHDTNLYDLQVDTGAGIETIHTTDNHPFWDQTTQAWELASKLVPGDVLVTDKGAAVHVVSGRPKPGEADMYNLTVNDLHTYYVLAGTTPVLVHNSGGCLTVLRAWSSQRFQFGNQTFLLDKKGMEHILTRHHPAYWDGSVKAQQSFFDSSMSIDDVQSAIGDVMQQNRETLIRRGGQGMYQIRGTVNGVDYVLGMNKGRVGQFYPIKPQAK
ncbi:RHS repeat-associated core domain-containing protein [Kitasatospora sp. NPDC088391]|uniref:RHS repeat-associated core domain-containing protein n=1 Tax=Kitasatospora sp. NPDC088391 TaxID=3364074 RepID=UPI0038020ED3